VKIKEEDVAKEVNVSEEDVKKAFEERKDSLKTEEMRKAKFVSFILTEDEQSSRDRSAAQRCKSSWTG
jgi:hypothetical protein